MNRAITKRTKKFHESIDITALKYVQQDYCFILLGHAPACYFLAFPSQQLPPTNTMSKIYAQLRQFHIYYELVVGLLSYVLLILVIYLAIYKTNRTMKEYSLIILLSSVMELIYTTVTLVAMPVSWGDVHKI
jgi:hypothetical protein